VDQKCFTISEVAADWHELMNNIEAHYTAIHCLRQRTKPAWEEKPKE